ncbi:hypothetical protein [Rhizobium ruizarguesonis]|uniref:hypothetical protein n=1 Tax=Rhizobium ruizarguesonis TaxID=2081791 RepID=UPI0018D4F2BA|nr:hypothetical protein [Rhizobium ruizarguesonis]
MASIQVDRIDGLASAAAIKGPCKCATTANISLYGEQTIDAVAVVTGNRVLVKNQTAASENGIWICDTGQWRRSKDFYRTNDVVKGTQVAITDGTVSGGFVYSLNTNNPINVGVTSLSFGIAAGVQTAVNAANAAAASAVAAAASAASVIPLTYVTKTGNYTAVAGDRNAWHRYTAVATVALTAAATLGISWTYKVTADGADVTIDPNGVEQINGTTTLVVPNGYSTTIVCSGTAFYSDGLISNTSLAAAFTQPFVNVASAATADIGAATSQNVTITGTTTITSFGTVAAGTVRNVVFSGALTLTHNATSLILPNAGANILTAAGDSLRAISLGSGNWRVTQYQKSDPTDVKAWVNFNGTGVVAIRASKNVSSITDNGTGDYTVNFTTALADANYAALITANAFPLDDGGAAAAAKTTTAYRFSTMSASVTRIDASNVNVVIMR